MVINYYKAYRLKIDKFTFLTSFEKLIGFNSSSKLMSNKEISSSLISSFFFCCLFVVEEIKGSGHFLLLILGSSKFIVGNITVLGNFSKFTKIISSGLFF